uniref:Secreted RxLR effector protein 24 n=1 Tax=Plasmopara viticola TaxID=143451 RepID=RLR24_PLAVT|nr:RecName: Full=Secreted RxLR effector protein 24; Flags: Precursor [Plasmopara viticola]
MRGAFYVAIALLGSHTAAECNQDEPQGAPNNDFLTFGGTIEKMLPRRVLRERRDSKDKLTVHAGAEERVMDPPPEAVEQAIMKTAGVMRTDSDDVIARAAGAIRAHEEIEALFRRIDPTLYNVNGQALHALPKPTNYMVSVASDIPTVPAKRAKVKASADVINNAAWRVSKHDLRLAPPEPSPSSIASSGIRFDNQPIAEKAFKLDLNKHSDEVEIINSNSKRKRIDLTPSHVGEQAPHPLPELQKYKVSVAVSIPMVLATKLEGDGPTLIMRNAANIITTHDFRPAPFGSSTRTVASSNSQIHSQPIAQEASKFALNVDPNEVKSLFHENLPLVGHALHTRVGNDELVPLATVNSIKAGNTQGPYVHKPRMATDEEIHAAFLEAFNLPFHQYLYETSIMIKIVKRQYKTSPGNHRIVESFSSLVNNQELSKLKESLGPDLQNLLAGMLELQDDLKSLREAYYVKLLIMYELFYDFCYVRLDLFDALVPKVDRTVWILKLKNYETLPSHD